MKKKMLCVVALAAVACMGAWEMNPLAWTHGESSRTLNALGLSSFAVDDSPHAANVRVEALVRPEGASTNGWATLGLAVYDDSRNFWHVALVRSTPEDGERHSFELCEMRNGAWLSQNLDKLRCLHRTQKGEWRYGETYRIALKMDAAAGEVAGEVKNAAGEVMFSCAYAIPKAEDDGSRRAVACGRAAFHTTGAFKGAFIRPVVESSSPIVRPAEFPAYASDSFMPSVKDVASGFFRVVEKDGRWRVIDPLGRGMVLLGVDHVTYHGHHSQRTGRSIHLEVNKRKFPNKADWEEDTLARLKKWGFNLLGAGCDPALKHRGLVHTVFLSIGDGLCWNPERPDLYICPNEHRPCSAFPNVFHPQFAAWADWKARELCAPNRDDPWLFGYFIDNELAWWGRGASATGLFNAVSKLPEDHSAKIAQKKFLAERGVAGAPSDSDKLAFLKLAADIYFRVSSEAIRRHDPNHIVMGARFAGIWGAHPVVWETAGKYCDLVTFNVYPWADLDRNAVFMDRSSKFERAADVFKRQYGYLKKPMLVTEWSFPALDSGLPCTGGAGQRFRTQRERTQATELFARTMLSLPFLVGYDYFMWVDEPAAGISDAFPEDSNYGLINEQGDAYPEITSMFERLHREVAERGSVQMPQERAAPAERGMTAAELLMRHPLFDGSERARAEFSRNGEEYAFENKAGLRLRGRIGGRQMFDAVELNGRALGSFNGMVCENVDGGRRWHDATRVVDAQLRNEILFVTSEGSSANDGRFSLTCAIRGYGDKPWFLCELVEAKNMGEKPIDVRTFYFREYAPYFADKLKMKVKQVPNLWKAPRCDAWFRQSDGAYYGGITFAPTCTLFSYHIMDGGRSQHPDAEFAPEQNLVLQPGGTYRPSKGSMWMLAICGLDGVEGWRRNTNNLSK